MEPKPKQVLVSPLRVNPVYKIPISKSPFKLATPVKTPAIIR